MKGCRHYSRKSSTLAFTRWELCVVLAVLGLFTALALPMLAGTRQASDNAQCRNNLRRMGQALHMAAMRMNNEFYWRAYVQDGGLYSGQARVVNAWFEFSFMSNELVTPKILACPADAGVRVAKDFPSLFDPNLRNNAISYTINLHALATQPLAAVFTDRDLRVTPGTACSVTGVANGVQFLPEDPTAGWTNAVHEWQGNLLRADGTAVSTTSADLRQAMSFSTQEDGPIHLVRAR